MKPLLIAAALVLSLTAGCVSTAPRRGAMQEAASAVCTLGDDELLQIALLDPNPTNRLRAVRCLSNDLFKARAVLGEASDRQVRLAAIEGLHSQEVINLLGTYCLPFHDGPHILTHDRWSDAALRIKIYAGAGGGGGAGGAGDPGGRVLPADPADGGGAVVDVGKGRRLKGKAEGGRLKTEGGGRGS